MQAHRRAPSPAAPVLILISALVSLSVIRCSERRPEAGSTSDALRGFFQSSDRKEALPPSRLGLRSRLTPLFYQLRQYRPAWLDGPRLRPSAYSLLDSLAAAEDEGLDPCDYGLDRARALAVQAERRAGDAPNLSSRSLAELDAVLTDGFFGYASHLSAGKADPSTDRAGPGWPPADESLIDLLEGSLEAGEIGSVLLGLRPQHELYFGLRRALGECRRELGRLEASAEGPLFAFPLTVWSPAFLREARLRYQVETIRLNMERWRWLPRFLGRRFVLIDTAAFRLTVYDRGRVPMSMKVVVGSLPWQTPILSANITGFIINPVWNCTSSIFYKETINYIKADKNYLSSNKMLILEGWGNEEKPLDPSGLDWAKVSPSSYPTLHLRQLPGPLNILGRLKFIMPNPEDIYLHDTPYQTDFKQDERIFSHGCIRAEHPFDLAAYLAGNPAWTKEVILAGVDSLEQRAIPIFPTVPIHVNYCTAWPRPDGEVEFRRDVYGRDEKLAAALGAFPSGRD